MEAVGRVLLKDSVYQSIRDAITRGELAPGAALRDGELAARLGVSKAPVRDALARLADDGLVESKILLDDRYHAGIYRIPDEQTLDAMRLAAHTEGMITDPVYEGKSMAAMIDLVANGEIADGSNVLYAHLGGQPALNGYSALFAQ